MSRIPVVGSPAPSGLFGVLRSWLEAQSSEISEAPDVLPNEFAAPNEHFCGSARVLVVDDNPANLMVMSALLESCGLVPILAADGAEAVALASELHFDLILMDLQMPILDGLGATSEIRRFEADSSRPAVPVLAYSSTTLAAGDLARHGMNGSLAKPCGFQELEDCLVRWCPMYRRAPAMNGVAYDGYSHQASRAPGTTAANRC